MKLILFPNERLNDLSCGTEVNVINFISILSDKQRHNRLQFHTTVEDKDFIYLFIIYNSL